jgi:hypothetical protein
MSQRRLSPELIETICAALRQGCHVKTACARAGVATSLMNEWLRRGRAEAEDRSNGETGICESVFEQFFHAVEQAKGEAVFSAETRVYDTNPLAWLRLGYPRNDWRLSNLPAKEAIEEIPRVVEKTSLVTPPQDLAKVLEILIQAGALSHVAERRGETPVADGYAPTNDHAAQVGDTYVTTPVVSERSQA